MTQTLTTGPVAGHLRAQALPMGMGLLAILSFEAVDLFFISRLGVEALVAASFAVPIVFLLDSIGFGFDAGVASTVSRAIGRGNRRQARRLTTDSVVLAFLIASVFAIVGLLTIRPLFTGLGATAEILPLIEQYMGVWYLVVPASTALWISLASIRARGNTLIEGRVLTAAALLNLALDPILIFGWLGLPALGIRGAAVASLIANLAMLAFTLILIKRLGVAASPFAPLAELRDSARRILKIGGPAMLTYAVDPIADAIVVAMAAAYGVHAVAGFGIAVRLEGIALIPFFALAAVSGPFFGQNLGAGMYGRLLEARRVALRFCLGFGLLLGLGLVLGAQSLAGLFTDSAAVRQVAVEYFWVVAIAYGAVGLAMVVVDSFNGLGAPIPATILSIASILVFLPLSVLGRGLFGLNGLFGAIAVTDVLVGCAAFYWLGKRVRRLSEESE